MERIQIFCPDGTVAPLAIGTVPAASENMLPPVAVTVASPVPRGRRRRRCPVLVLTVNGPTALPAGPLTLGGVMVRLGGGGWISGPSTLTLFTMATTALCRASDVLST